MRERENYIFNIAQPELFPPNGRINHRSERVEFLNELNIQALSAEGDQLNPLQLLAVANYAQQGVKETLSNQRRFCEWGAVRLEDNAHGKHQIDLHKVRTSEHEVRGYAGIKYGATYTRWGCASILMEDPNNLYHQPVHYHPETPEALVLKATAGSGYVTLEDRTFEFPEDQPVFCQIPEGKEHTISFYQGITLDFKNIVDHKKVTCEAQKNGTPPNTEPFQNYPRTTYFPMMLTDPNYNEWNVSIAQERTPITVAPGELTLVIPLDHHGIFHPYAITAHEKPFNDQIEPSLLYATTIADPLKYACYQARK